MQNQNAAVSRRLEDPDYQARLLGRSLMLNLGMALLVAVMAVHATYVWLNPPKPLYFFVDGKTPPRPAVSLDSPIVDDTQLLQWTVNAVLAAYNVNYRDYPEQLNTAGRRFSIEGWNSFATAYMKGGNLDAMKRGRMLCYAQVPRACRATIKVRTPDNQDEKDVPPLAAQGGRSPTGGASGGKFA